jgi:uncharacterized protein (DUF1330 family)
VTRASRKLRDAYGAGAHAPSEARWRALLEADPAAPLVVTNLFRVREQADPRWTGGEALSGFEAMLRYSAVSEAKVAALGGSFAVRALCHGTLIGDEGAWNLIAVAEYPRREQLLALFEDPEYQAAFHFRTAALEAQQVLLASPI